MRELLLLVIVGVLCVVGLVRPLYGLYAYTWFALMRPDVFAWSNGRFPYSMALAVVTLLGSLRVYPQFQRILTNPICLLLIVFQIPLFSSVLTAVDSSLSWPAFTLFERAIILAMMIPVLVTTAPALKTFLLIMGVSLGVLGTKFGLFGLLAGGVRLSQGFEGTMLADNNDLALALVMAIPPMWCLRTRISSVLGKSILLGMSFCTMAAVVMTYSRGGAVTLVVVLLLMVMRSKHKIGALIVLGMLVGPAIYLVGDSYQERLFTIMDPTKEASANSRFELAKAAYHMWQDYPLTGVGFGGTNFASLSYRYTTVQNGSVAHNTYMQVLVDSGIFAFVLYLFLLWGTIIWLGFSIRRTRLERPDLVAYPIALQTSLIAFGVGAYFLSRLSLDITYQFLMASASWWAVARQERMSPQLEEEDAEGLSDSPTGESLAVQ